MTSLRFLDYTYELAMIRALLEMKNYQGGVTDLANAHGKVTSLPNINQGVIKRAWSFLDKNGFVTMLDKSTGKLTVEGLEIAQALAVLTRRIEKGIDWNYKPQKQ